MKKIILKIVFFIIVVVVYLNAGWTLGTYYHNNIFFSPPQTTLQTIAKGAWQSMEMYDISKEKEVNILLSQIIFMIFWPLFFAGVGLSWLVYGFYYFLWLVFAGGIAKLLEVG